MGTRSWEVDLSRSLAKSAGIPLFSTSVSAWFANEPGYLDSAIKQIDQVFAEAAAVAPALLFIDEGRRHSIEG
ncbi:AAA family ATPase [Devosia sp. RR2S18]|uniref:AAA family ATPase n=1 Tax=Devosia rhizosphaerae TaxID=3049774 RepID=UPI0032EEFCDC